MSIQTVQEFGSLIVDHDARQVFANDNPVHLTNTEYTLLATLVAQPRHAFRSEYLLRLMTGSDWAGETHALQVYVSRLRAKLRDSGLDPNLVMTVRGFGYRFEPGMDSQDDHMAPPRTVDPLDPDAEHEAFLLLDLHRTILWASESVESLLGWQAKGIEGTSLFDLIHPEDQPRALAARDGLDAGCPAASVMRFRTATENYRPLERITRPLIDKNGKSLAFHSELHAARDHRRAVAPSPSVIHLESNKRHASTSGAHRPG